MELAGRVGLRLVARVAATLVIACVSPAAMAQPSEIAAKPDASLELRGVQLQREMQIELEIDQPNKTRLGIRQIVFRLGGTIVQEQDLYMRVTVPVEHWDEVISSVGALGVEVSRRGSANEKFDEFVVLIAEMKALQQAEERVSTFRTRARSVEERLELEQEIRRIRGQLDSVRARRQALSSEVTRGSLVISLQLRRPLVPEQIHPVKLPIPWLEKIGLDSLKDLSPSSREPAAISRSLDTSAELFAHVTTARLADPDKTGGARSSSVFGFTFRGIPGSALAIGTDAAIGPGYSGGAAYDTRFLLGLGTGLGENFTVSLMSGVGTSGVTGGRVPGGLEVPVELSVSAYLSRKAYATLWARPAFVFGEEAKKEGASHAPFGDTMRAGGRICLGHETGVVLGGQWEEVMGTGGFAVIVGYGLAIQSSRFTGGYR